MDFEAFLKAFKKFIEQVAPALAVILWNYEEAKIEDAKDETKEEQLELTLELNHEKVDQENSGKSDLSIIESSLNGESGKGGTGQPDSNNK